MFENKGKKNNVFLCTYTYMHHICIKYMEFLKAHNDFQLAFNYKKKSK